MTDEVYERHRYDVSALDCYNQLLDIIEENETLDGLKIPIEEYASRLQISIEVYAEVNRIDDNWSQSRKNNAFLVATDEPSFDWWFAIYLSLVEDYEVPLILNYYQANWNNKDVDFVNFVEFIILEIQKRNLFHDFKVVTNEIVRWISENRKEKSNAAINFLIINIQNNDNRSFHHYFEEHYHMVNSKKEDQGTDNEIGKSHLFNEPYHGYLLKELLAFCEEDSKGALKELLRGEKIKDPVILKSNFLMVSLRRALMFLMSKGDAHMIKEECVEWLFKNFRIRGVDGLKEFKPNGTRDVFRKTLDERYRSQIKFWNWYK